MSAIAKFLANTKEYDPPYLIDGLLPSHEIHLLAGPTGAGKTTWLFDMLRNWERGDDILGCQSHPVPWIYVAGDRSDDGMYRTMDRMRIPHDAFLTIPAWDQHMTFQQILDHVSKSGAKLAVLEGFGQYVDPPGQTKQVRDFLCSACGICKKEKITIIGVVESPKMKPRDQYENPRQRVSGPAAWGHHSETIFLMEPRDASRPSDAKRMLTVCPRNAAGLEIPYVFKFGHLQREKASKNGHSSLLNPIDM